jgi:hypothetical protein
MKVDSKQLCSLIVLAALFLFLSASPWEGDASIAPEGELPASGFFIATNSFPKNTLVDITNLETNQSTRVIVANTLNSQGLLAIVSKEAALLIGMKPGAIGRVRIVQPTEPIAYYRFTEGLLSGNPVYDSGNAARDRLYSEDTFTPSDGEKTEPVTVITGPRYILEPEWQNREIVNFYPDTAKPPPVEIERYVAKEEPVEEEPELIAEEEPVEEEPELIAEEEPVEEEPECIAEEEPVEEEPECIAEEEPVEEEPECIAEEEPVEEEPECIAEEEPVEEEPEHIVEEEPVEEEPEYTAETPFNLVPAPERPPEGSIYGIDPSLIIPGIAETVKEPEKPVVPIVPVVPVVPVVPDVPENVFSVPRLTQLDRGRYYVQLAAYSTVESTENAVRQIDRSYGPVVFIDGDVYRILLGPLNQGESAAVLQRFKSIGYKDAFVRHVR